MKSKLDRRGLLVSFAAFTVLAGVGRADPITYQVTQGPFGLDGATVSGTVQTDGTIGTLASTDILNWNVVVTDGLGGSFDLMNANSALSLNGTAVTATATALQFNFGSAPPLGTLGDFEILDAANGWGWELALPSVGTTSEAVLPRGGNGDAGLAALFPQPITLGRLLAPLTLQGGTTSSAVSLVGTSIGQINGTIGGFGSVDYYGFSWGGGAFSATAAITGASFPQSYLYSLGAAGNCGNVASEPLTSTDGFTDTIFQGNLAAGQYCIGIDANSPVDPNFSLTFNTPVSGVPEPSGFVALAVGLGVVGVLRKAQRSRNRALSRT